KRRDDNYFIIARPDGHADAVVLAALVFAEERVRLGIKEVGVRIEDVQHAGDGAVVDRLIGIHRLGIVLLDYAVNVSELAQAVAHIGVAAGRGRRSDLLPEQHAEKATGDENKNNQEERATRTTDHLLFPSLRARQPSH